MEPEIEYGINTTGKKKGKIPFVNIEHLREDGSINTEEIGYVQSADNKKILKKDDILISRSRLVGVCSLVTEKEEGFTFGSYILRMRSKKDSILSPEYLVSFLNSDLGQAQVRMLETGAFGKNINTDQLKLIQIPISSPEVSTKITRFLRKTWKELRDSKKRSKYSVEIAKKKQIEFLLGTDVDLNSFL
ncbi:MAG: restriction endonuclease subunit S [Candidatus Hodarchaeales archaeon]